MTPVEHCEQIDLYHLSLPATKTVLSAHCFRVAAQSVWNSIPFEIRSAPLLATFRRQLKTLFYRQAFN